MNLRAGYAFLVMGLLSVCGCGLDSLGTDRVFLTLKKISFDSTLVGARGPSQDLELVNLGKSAVTIGTISMSGRGAGAFRAVNPCGSTLPGRGRCLVQVSFEPTVEGENSAVLSISGPVGSVPQTVSLNGTGSAEATADVVVFGATPAGVMAAVEAGRHGRTVLLVDSANHLGGMMTNGLGYSDFYDPTVIGGLPKEFYRLVSSHYGSGSVGRNGRLFEPHVAEATFLSMLAGVKGLSVALGVELAAGGVERSGTTITTLVTRGGQVIHGREFVDASYTGDLMAAAGVKYVVGRESREQYGEDLGGVNQLRKMGNVQISAYVRPGEPASGLIAHVTGPESVGGVGTGDRTLMGYNYRLCLSSNPANQIRFTAPAGYRASEYELMRRLAALNPALGNRDFLDVNALPNQKFDYNNTRSLFSSDEVGVNTGYPDGDATTRAAIAAEHKRYMQGLLYFLSTDAQIPASVRSFVKGYGLCKDEFVESGGWPEQLYVREARRMVGAYVMTEKDVKGETSIPDSIGVGGYTVDDHIHHIVSAKGIVTFEAGRGYDPAPYRIPYRSLTPKVAEATNLLVPVDVSASHVAYDSLRIEVTYMVMGQAAGAAAVVALEGNGVVQDVGYGALRAVLDGDGVVVGP